MDALIPKITDAGLEALLNAQNTGVDAALSHIGFGDANGERYSPSAFQTGLKNERARTAIGGGDRIDQFEIVVEAILDQGPSFWVNEIGFFLNDGTMLAVWAAADKALSYKTQGVPLAVAYNLALSGIPPGSVTLNVSGPSVVLSVIGPMALLSAEIIRAHRLAMTAELERVTPNIKNKWR